MKQTHLSYWQTVWKQFRQRKLGVFALMIVALFIFMAIYAPFFASSRPIFLIYDKEAFFPLLRYLFYPGFFSKPLDIFYNLLIFTFPVLIFFMFLFRNKPRLWRLSVALVIFSQIFGFLYLIYFPPVNPAFSPKFVLYRQALFEELAKDSQNSLSQPNWNNEVGSMSAYAKLNLILRYQAYREQHLHLRVYEEPYLRLAKLRGQTRPVFPTLWNLTYQSDVQLSDSTQEGFSEYEKDRLKWLEEQSSQIKYKIMPLLRSFHWEDDAGGDQALNQFVSWWDLTRINRKDMVAALIFGIRISLSVGLLAVGLALCVGIPIGALSGFYGGKVDLITYRLIEVWESMPTFFMLLMVVAFLQSKSIFLVIGVIGLFGWTGFSRFIRGEFLKQKQLPYVEACRALGYKNNRTIFSHILPNAIPPLLTLVPFAIMGAITSEAGLSFLGLGEEGSNSWGVLMDEGRTAFPSESYLLWPPAILLTILLVSIALVGDSLRDALDPKLHRA